MILNNPNEIVGNIYNDMKVIEYVETNKYFMKIYKVICLKCGKTKNIEYAKLNKKEEGTFHSNKFCGVYLEEYDNNIGLTINDYTIIKLDSITKHGYRYITKCNICGMEHSNLISNFKKEYSTKHCECPLHIPRNKYMKRFKKIWDCMRQRTTNPNYNEWKYYGGRGINSDYFSDFIIFYKDMFNSYIEHVNTYGEKDTTIDRIDVNSDYNKDNCRWATVIEQANNKRSNRYITINNETKTMKQWADIYNIQISTVKQRLDYGWDDLEAFTSDTNFNKKKHIFRERRK